MKETDIRKGSNNKEKSSPARPESRNHKLQGKNGGRNMRAREIDSKHSSDKQEANKFVGDLKSGAECPEVYESMVIDHVDDVLRSEEALDSSKTCEIDDNLGNEKLNDNSSDMDIADESDPETINDSVSSQGDPQTADEEKAQNVRVTKKSAKGYLTDGCSHAPRVRSDKKTNSVQSKASKATPKKGAKPEKVPPKSTAKGSSVNSKNVKIHPKPQSDSSDGADARPLEQLKGVEILDEAPNSAHNVCSDDEVITNEENDNQEENAALDQKIEEMETRIKNLESELREVAALEIALYSIVPEHGSSAHKVHTPARRLSRLYSYACKYWSQDRRATVSKNTVSRLVLVFKSCGNDVPRLMFWLSNTVALREIISQAFGSSCHSSTLAKAFESQDGEKSETKSSSVKRRTSVGNRQLNKQSFLQFVDDWQETRTFTAALEKVESWIFSRIVDSIWWQTLAPNMQSPAGDSSKKKGAERLLGPALGDQKQGSFSINLWRNAFHDALKRLCPVRAGGHECGCLPVLARKVMEQCIGRLDVAMFNAILRESAHEIPTDPVSDPIVDTKVLPIPAGDLSFGSGAQLKNSVGNWARWLDDFLGMDTDSSSKDENDEKGDTREPKSFPLLNDLSDLLMLPKDMLMDRTIRMEICPSISLPLVKRVLCNFTPDEFCPDPVPGAVLEALNAESIIEHRLSVESNNSSFPYSAAPVVYTPPPSSDVAEKVAEAGANSQLSRSASSVQRKGYTSDEELDELECCLTCIIDKFPSSPTAVVNRRNGNGDSKEEVGYNNGDNARYDLLREVWRSG